MIAVLSAGFLGLGCSTMVNWAGKALDGSAFKEKQLAVYDNGAKRGELKVELWEARRKDDGAEGIIIRRSDLPGFELRGTMPDSDGRFELTSAVFLSSHYSGWNEFSLDLFSSAVFTPGSDGNGGLLRITGTVERVQIADGGIRLKSSRIGGNDALTNLRNRRERIIALTEWMARQIDVPSFANQGEFENYWKPRLLPEMTPKKRRPPEWNKDGGEWVKAGGVKWNRSYTKHIFPEELWILRDSGVLLRDWEESLPWLYLEYNWDSIITSFNGVNLIRKK